jgi:hypothetical protein
MPDIETILSRTGGIFDSLTRDCKEIPEDIFFTQPADKWSIAQNLQHLILTTRTTTFAFKAPRFLLKWLAGKPNRQSRSYDELVAKYKSKLQQGGKAPPRFTPKGIAKDFGKESLLEKWSKANEAYTSSLKSNWVDKDLDRFIVKHPLLGRITMRELAYFTMYHTLHHHQIIQDRLPH